MNKSFAFVIGQVKVILRPTTSRSACLGVRHTSGTRDQFFSFFLELFSDSYGFVEVVPSLMRSRVCSFQFLLDIASDAFLRCKSHGTYEHILLSLFSRLPHLYLSCIYSPQEQGSPVVLPEHWICLINLHIFAGYLYGSCMYNKYIRPLLVQAQYSSPIKDTSGCITSLIIWTVMSGHRQV
jgi:hypothetical protein